MVLYSKRTATLRYAATRHSRAALYVGKTQSTRLQRGAVRVREPRLLRVAFPVPLFPCFSSSLFSSLLFPSPLLSSLVFPSFSAHRSVAVEQQIENRKSGSVIAGVLDIDIRKSVNVNGLLNESKNKMGIPLTPTQDRTPHGVK
jgi:hypothetical protein